MDPASYAVDKADLELVKRLVLDRVTLIMPAQKRGSILSIEFARRSEDILRYLLSLRLLTLLEAVWGQHRLNMPGHSSGLREKRYYVSLARGERGTRGYDSLANSQKSIRLVNLVQFVLMVSYWTLLTQQFLPGNILSQGIDDD